MEFFSKGTIDSEGTLFSMEVVRIINNNDDFKDIRQCTPEKVCYHGPYRMTLVVGEHVYYIYLVSNLPSWLVGDDKGTVVEKNFRKLISLRHRAQYLPKIHSVKRYSCFGDQYIFIDREYIPGMTIAEYIDKHGSSKWNDVVSIFHDVLTALDVMHEKLGWLHHNIAPENIVVREDTKGKLHGTLIGLNRANECTCFPYEFDIDDINPYLRHKRTFEGTWDIDCEVFSVGVCLLSMIDGRKTYCYRENNKFGTRMLESRREIIYLVWNIKGLFDEQKSILEDTLNDDRKPRYGRFRDFQLVLDEEMRYTAFTSPDRWCKTKAKEQLQSDGMSQVNEKPIADNKPKESEKPKENHNHHKDYENDPTITLHLDFVTTKWAPGKGFHGVAGMDELKDQLRRQVLFPIRNTKLCNEYGISPLNGMLLYGPPGCGKTFIAQKFAEESGMNFCFVKASDINSMWVGATTDKLRQLFKQAQEHAPCIVCVDEIDSLIPSRDDQNTRPMIVNEWLTQLNNCNERGIFVIGTTNRPDMIDIAARRTGRLDHMIYVPMPDKKCREAIFRLSVMKKKRIMNIDFPRLAEMTEGYTCSDISAIINEASLNAAMVYKPLTGDILEKQVLATRKSLSADDMAYYERLRHKMENGTDTQKHRRIGFC